MATEHVPYSGPIVTRAEARERNLKWYFTGRPCKRGHLSQRATLNGACPSCHALAKIDPIKRRARQKKWEAANRDKIRARGRKYSKEHREQATAWASQPENREHKNAVTRARYMQTKATNPDKLKEKWRRDYNRNPKAAIAATRRWQAAHPEQFAAYRLATKEAARRRGKQWALNNPDRMRARSAKWRLAHSDGAARCRVVRYPGSYLQDAAARYTRRCPPRRVRFVGAVPA